MEKKRYEIIKKYISINNDSIILGIGEGYRQTIPSEDVKKFYNCDYFSNEEIRKERGISSESEIENKSIMNIDFVCKDNNYVNAINKENYFDLIISNHCFEHLDNFIDMFRQMNKLLKNNGYLFITLPDKKYSFDNLRSNTEISHLIYDNDNNDNNIHHQHMIETELFYNYKNPPNNIVEWWHSAKNRMEGKKYNKYYEIIDNRFTEKIHPGVHRHVFESETFVSKIIEPMLFLYFDNFELIASDFINNTGDFFTILQKKENANIKFPDGLFIIK